MYFNIDKKTHDTSFCNFTENFTFKMQIHPQKLNLQKSVKTINCYRLVSFKNL